MEWFMGRSRKKAADGKENLQGVGGRGWKAPKFGFGGRGAARGAGQCKHSLDAAAEHSQLQRSLSGDFSVCEAMAEDHFQRLAALPPSMSENEWMATHLLSFFDNLNSLYGVLVDEFCTPISCPIMTEPALEKQLLWTDERGKKWKYSAPQYIDSVMSLVDRTLYSEQVCPTKHNVDFSANFKLATAKRLAPFLWYIIAHIVSRHWDALVKLDLGPQLSALAAHYLLFSQNLSLLETKDLLNLESMVIQLRPPPVMTAEQSLQEPNTQSAEKVVNEKKGSAIDVGGNDGSKEATLALTPTPSAPLRDFNRKAGSWGGDGPIVEQLRRPCAQSY